MFVRDKTLPEWLREKKVAWYDLEGGWTVNIIAAVIAIVGLLPFGGSENRVSTKVCPRAVF